MPRKARRRSVSPPPPAPSRTLTATIWALAGKALVLWPLAAMAAAVGAGLLIEQLQPWADLNAALQSLDFDPGRAALIQAWLAGLLVALLAAGLSGRPWLSVLTATGFVAVTYAWPLGDQLARQVPDLFGEKFRFQTSALHHNQLVTVSVAFVAGLPAAATGDLLRRSAIAVGISAWRLIATRRVLSRRAATLAGALVVGGALAASLVLVRGVDPLLRYGPDHGVYLAPSVAPRTIVDPVHPSATPEAIPTAGQVVAGTYHSASMGEDRHFLIYLPPTYGLKAAAKKHYPVLYLLHGDPGGPSQWVQFGAPGIFDAGSARGTLPETILVLPDGNGHVTAATQWADRYDGRDRIEDALLELVDVVDDEYRTIPDRQHRLIAGLSSGAFGAANIAARHPDLFGIEMSFSGYYVANGPVFGYNPAYIRNNSPYYIVQDEASARTVRYILVVGDRDPYYKRSTEAFAAQLARLNVPYDLSYLPGGHGSNIWTGGLVLGMDRMAQSLSPTFRTTEFGKTHGSQY